MATQFSFINKSSFSLYSWISVAIAFLGIWLVFSNFLPAPQAFTRAVVAVTFFLTVAIVNLRILIPSFFPKKQFLLYAAAAIFFGILLTAIRYYLENKLSIPVSLIRKNALNGSITFSERQKFTTLFFAHSLIFLLSLTYYFGRAWFEADKREALLKSERLEAEINFLRSQINPHFLINILNNIYALSYLKDDRTPNMLLKLSDMMRYLIYDSNQQSVLLQKEIYFFESYIELQKMKNKNYDRMIVTVQGINEDDKIPPLLLLPFFENVFKHSDIEINVNSEASIEISIASGILKMKTHNTKGRNKANSESSGFGLRNARQQSRLVVREKLQARHNR
ncbi:MAG: histidine kinase [Cyclobacteriaceae bacterium]